MESTSMYPGLIIQSDIMLDVFGLFIITELRHLIGHIIWNTAPQKLKSAANYEFNLIHLQIYNLT